MCGFSLPSASYAEKLFQYVDCLVQRQARSAEVLIEGHACAGFISGHIYGVTSLSRCQQWTANGHVICRNLKCGDYRHNRQHIHCRPQICHFCCNKERPCISKRIRRLYPVDKDKPTSKHIGRTCTQANISVRKKNNLPSDRSKYAVLFERTKLHLVVLLLQSTKEQIEL